MFWMVTVRPDRRDQPRQMAVFVGGLVAVTAVLVVRDPWFGLFTPAGYLYAFRLLPWPGRLSGVAAVAVVAGTAQVGGLPSTGTGVATWIAVVAANVVPMCGTAWLDQNTRVHVAEREQTLARADGANRKLAAMLAENAGLHRQLVAQAHEAGVLDERQRLAREIHDTLAQGLAGIVTQLQAAEHAEADPTRRRRHLNMATALARESLTEARRSVDELRPEPLDGARLGEALTEVAARWTTLAGIPVVVVTTGAVRPLPPDVEVVLLRVAQEALANVARHAQAGRVVVTLSYLAGEVALDVRDDGCGFDPAWGGDRAGGGGAGQGGGFGLVAMRQRVEGLAGTLLVESGTGIGTAVSARLPQSASPAVPA